MTSDPIVQTDYGSQFINMTATTPFAAGTIRTVEVCRHHTIGTSVIRAADGISFSVQGGEFIALLESSGYA